MSGSEQYIMDTALDDWIALNEHAREDGYELTKQLAEFDTCTNQPEKYEVYDKDMLEVSPEKIAYVQKCRQWQ